MDILVYTAPNCSACYATKAWLKRNKLHYIEVDVTADATAAEQLREAGHLELPVVVANEETWTGFRMCKLHKLIGHQ